ncbi:MAG: DUF5060 domain-containing protein [Armatimonadota bacterium]
MNKNLKSRRAFLVTLPLACGVLIWARGGKVLGQTMTYNHIEASFPLPDLTGNPFDYTENDIQATFRQPDGKSVTIPAFFDGGTDNRTWRIRYTPRVSGDYTLTKITRNGSPIPLSAVGTQKWTVAKNAAPQSGFVRRDPKNLRRFLFDNGSVYYPLGINIAWGSQGLDVPTLITKLGAAGGNWTRIWMNHWDRKNLDWVDSKSKPGVLDLEVARKWDGIVTAAEKSGVRFQMVLQHHGQYSSTVNPNWGENPWNAANGGFLQKSEEFFTNPRARALTKAKYRYIIARWGYSPSVLAWELFNEVQFVDALRNKTTEGHAAVIAWHKEMAAFLKAQDPEHHLVATSSDTDIEGLYDTVDYVQPHSYPPDAITMAASLEPEKWNKPIFFGEVGPSGGDNRLSGSVYEDFLHASLWASLMQSGTAGAAQFWYWDKMENDGRNLFRHYQAASAFLKQTNLASLEGMKNISPMAATTETGAVSLGPGAGWGAAKQTDFVVASNGDVPGIAMLPSFLQGKNHADLFTGANFQVDYTKPGTFAVRIRQAAKAGAHLVLSVDGKTAAEHDFPASENDTSADVTVTAQVPAGKHTIRLENSGTDWVVLNRISLAPYGSALKAMGKSNGSQAALWVRRVAPGTGGGTITLPSGTLKPGSYEVRWWDTRTGREITREAVRVASGEAGATFKAPAIAEDAAAFLAPK